MGKEAQKMPLRYKINILNALKEKGYNTNRIRTEGLFSQSTLQKLREGKGLSWENIERICGLLECQPGDLIEYVQENNWFHKHISACSKSQKSAGYAPVSVQQMRNTLLRTGGVFREKEASLARSCLGLARQISNGLPVFKLGRRKRKKWLSSHTFNSSFFPYFTVNCLTEKPHVIYWKAVEDATWANQSDLPMFASIICPAHSTRDG